MLKCKINILTLNCDIDNDENKMNHYIDFDKLDSLKEIPAKF